ncbi:hypothetical protein HZA33_04510 [Candidatus Pacearchaeota archaeon]|nr:hypothetical protein [Candidatus Pacearchaeota archaeon]
MKKIWKIGKLWRGKHLPNSLKKKESLTKRKNFRTGKTKPTWQGKHLPEYMKKKISKIKIILYKQGKIKPYWKNKKPPFYKCWLGKKRDKETTRKANETKRLLYLKGKLKGPNLGKKLSREWRSNMSKSKIKYFRNKANRKKLSLIISRLYARKPEIKRLIAKKLEERYKNHPYLRKEESKRKQLYYETHPEARKNLLSYWKNPERQVKAMNNLIVKSEGERVIANMLYKNKIKPNYESIELNFNEMDPIPDFYPQGNYEGKKISNIFIEFYGGHPKSWKRKVEKNKLYQKYKIPVIAITPREVEEIERGNVKPILGEMARLSQSKEAKNFNLKKWQLIR